MGLDIYFYDGVGECANELDSEDLHITHNLNTVVSELGLIVGKPYYEMIWRPDELLCLKNGEVPVSFVLVTLPQMIKDVIKYESLLKQFLPDNGYGTMDDLVYFLCNYLSECFRHKDAYIYCCR